MNIESLQRSYSLEDKVAIITGASKPNGMGLAIARKLGERGASLIITELPTAREELQLNERMAPGSSETLAHAVETLTAEGLKVVGVPVDVTVPDQVHACVAEAEKSFGGVDIVVNNAGVFVGEKPFFDLADSAWEISWQVHVKGAMEFCKAAIPAMRKRGGGVIINNASIAGLIGVAEFSAYGTTKSAMVALTKNLAAEFGGENIRIHAVCPGNITTDISAGEAEEFAKRHGVTVEDVEQTMLEPIALGRYGTPNDVAEVVAFLAAPAASYLTGLAIPVTGGMNAGLV